MNGGFQVETGRHCPGNLGKDGDGKVTVVNNDGSRETLASGLDDPKGIDLFDNVLYVADNDKLFKITLNGQVDLIAGGNDFPGKAVFLNDIEIDGNGNDRVWEESRTTTTKTYTDVNAPSSGGIALPGTYSEFNVRCDTVMASGIYVIDGGVFKVNADTSLSGQGVMFVLKNGAGVPADQVDDLLGMLIFEDPDSPGSEDSQITGSSSAVFDGIIYLPNSPLKIAGTPKGNSQCLVIATKTLQFAGTTDVSSLCPTGATPKGTALVTNDRVLLVG